MIRVCAPAKLNLLWQNKAHGEFLDLFSVYLKQTGSISNVSAVMRYAKEISGMHRTEIGNIAV